MRWLVICSAILLSFEVSASAQATNCNLEIQLETRQTAIAGLPSAPPYSTKKNQPSEKIVESNPPSAQRKSLAMVFSTNVKASTKATVSVVPPASSGLEDTMEFLVLTPSTPTEIKAGQSSLTAGMSINRYWGSSPTIAPGQPVEWISDKMTAEQIKTLSQLGSKFRPAAQVNTTATTAFWPGSRNPMGLPTNASAAGTWALKSFAGAAAIDIPANLDFLPIIQITSPDTSLPCDFNKPLTIAWKPTAGVEGYHISAAAPTGKQNFVVWTTESVDKYIDVKRPLPEMLRDNTLLGSETTTATIPAGIFKTAKSIHIIIEGLGKGMKVDGSPSITLKRITITTLLVRNQSGSNAPAPPKR